MKRKPTIKDIAQLAKVSATAVSLALNKRSGVSENTRQKIMKIAQELEYQPNYMAKGLIGSRSYTIGLIINNIGDPFYPELALGIEQKANELGYSLILGNINRSLEREKQSLDTLRAKGVDGIILATVTVDDPNIAPLIKDRFPLVLVNRFSMDPELENRVDYVVMDNYAAGYKGVRHLYQLGHDRIALIAGALNTSTGKLRIKGALQALKELGLSGDAKWVAECDYLPEKAYDAANRLLSMKNRPTAVFAHGDNMALAIREAVLKKGLLIPEEVALMGVDNIQMGSLTGVDLTTLSQKTYEMGRVAVEILIAKIEKDTPYRVNKVVLEAELITRKSCGFHLRGYVR